MLQIAQVDIGDVFFGRGENPELRQITGVGDLVSLGVRIAFVIAGLLVLFFIIFGGYSIIAGAGSDNPEQAARGKQAATAAVIGFVILFASYWIVQLIQAITGIAIVVGVGGGG
jgi:hypothetical protein